MAPPRRPGLPLDPRPFVCPPRPAHWHPGPRVPLLQSILGITLGTALNVSLNYLFNQGYAVDGYGTDVVYLRNVPQLNLYWPDATLYYGPAGGLIGSEFVYSTLGYDRARYNTVYNILAAQYGNPYVQNLVGGGVQATWWGSNNSFISLQFNSQMSVGGQMRYFTTLTFGN